MRSALHIWKWIAGVLALLNLALLLFFWYKPDQQHKRFEGGPGDLIVHSLNFTPAQADSFEILKKTHSSTVFYLHSGGKKLRDEMFDLLKQERPDMKQVQMKISEIGKNQEQIEYVTFVHFVQVRQMCTPEQKTKFDSIIKDVLHRMARHPRKDNRAHAK